MGGSSDGLMLGPRRTFGAFQGHALLLLAALALSCGDGPAAPPEPASLTVIPSSVTLASIGETAPFSASITDQHGAAFAGQVEWRTSHPAVFTVTTGGVVEAVGNGSGTLTASFQGLTATASVTVADAGLDDRKALTALYEATDGPNWNVKDNWLTAAPLENWYGVQTDDQGRVTLLNLVSNALTGEIPPELGNLANLGSLSLGDNRLTGEIPPELGNLANLGSLSLADNRLTGEVPPELGNLVNLEWLHLDDNDLTGELPPELGNLANLQELWLNRNDLTGELPPELGNLANLERLDLWNNDLTGEVPPELGNLVNLEWLGLERNDLTGEVPPELGNLANLGSLFLGDNRLTGEVPPELGNLANLVDLWLYGNDLTGEVPPELGDLVNLEWLRLERNDLTGELPPELGSLANLWWLELYSNALTGEIPPELGNLANLEELWLNENDLTGEVPPELGNLANLQWLHLQNNDLTGEVPTDLGNLANLKQMFWFGNAGLCAPGTRQFIDFAAGLNAAGPFCHEADAAVLGVLYESAGGSSWTASNGWLQPGPLSDWHGVETDTVAGRVVALDLSGNGLSGALPGSLSSLKALRELRVHDNSELGGRLPLAMTALALRALRYDGTGLCTPADPSFRDWLRSIASHAGNGVECPPLTDRDVLEILYGSTGGSNWNRKDNWLTELPLAHWLGVQTDDQGRVTSINLPWNDLTGVIPPELGNLANLLGLALYGNDLTGEIPPELGNLANLQALWLNENDLTGEIPAELGNLANLQLLWLNGNDLTGEIPPELGNLASLGWLRLDDNDLTGEIPAELGNLANLQELQLAGNDLTGGIPPSWANLASLERLDLSHNAGISGTLPAAWTSLEMSELQLGGTGLCAPPDAAFQSWLRSIPLRRVSMCAERTGGKAKAEAYIVQAIQSFAFPVPLVAGRPGLLRVFASVPQAGGARAPAARATFYQQDGSERTIEVPSGNGRLSAELQEGSLRGSANVEVPGDVLRPGVEMVVEVDPAGVLDPGLGVPARIPAEGRTALEVYELPSFDVTVVPFLWETDPDSSILDMTRGMTPDDSLFEETRRLLPVGAMSVTVHEPVWSSSNSALDLLRETEAIRTLENGGGYWMGTIPEATDAAGLAWVPGRSQFSVPVSFVIAHEFGHNIHLSHAPCGGASRPDPAYPDRQGRVGAWGWDRRSGTLVPPERWDLMSYCGPNWVGDYHFARSLRWRMHDEAGVAAFKGPPTRVLLLWGGADADGTPFLNPAFVVDDARASVPDGTGEWRIVGEAEDGRALFDRAFEMAEIADGDGRQSFVFALPAEAGWADALTRIVLTGPDGEVTMDAQSGPAAALLRDPATGRVRGILRDWPDPATQADAAASLPESGLEVQVSRGLPAPDAWRR